MARDTDVSCRGGRWFAFEYKFIVNGNRWIEDPSNGMKVPDKFGGLNSVVVLTTDNTDL